VHAEEPGRQRHVAAGGVEHAGDVAIDDDVQFTVYRPVSVQPLQWRPLIAFAHRSSRPPDEPDEPLRGTARSPPPLLLPLPPDPLERGDAF